jgi:hypothetical protein
MLKTQEVSYPNVSFGIGRPPDNNNLVIFPSPVGYQCLLLQLQIGSQIVELPDVQRGLLG